MQGIQHCFTGEKLRVAQPLLAAQKIHTGRSACGTESQIRTPTERGGGDIAGVRAALPRLRRFGLRVDACQRTMGEYAGNGKGDLRMAATNIKDEARKLIENMPDDSTWDDLMHKIYVRQAIESGLADSQAARTTSVESLRTEFGLEK